MALDKTTLASALKTTFQRAKDEQWTSDQVADAISDAVDAFVRGADVSGVHSEVRNLSNAVIGSGAQDNVVHPS